jgi:hypothetical protein
MKGVMAKFVQYKGLQAIFPFLNVKPRLRPGFFDSCLIIAS